MRMKTSICSNSAFRPPPSCVFEKVFKIPIRIEVAVADYDLFIVFDPIQALKNSVDRALLVRSYANDLRILDDCREHRIQWRRSQVLLIADKCESTICRKHRHNKFNHRFLIHEHQRLGDVVSGVDETDRKST